MKKFINFFYEYIVKFFYKLYNLILNFIPQFFYKYIIKIFNDLKILTEQKYYKKKNKYKLEIEDVTFYVYSRNLEIFLDVLARVEKKIPQPNWEQENIYIYEYPAIKILQSIFKIEKEPIFMDIGAFQGYFTFFAAKYLGDKHPVYAIESNKEYCKDLETSLKINNFTNCNIINEILSDKEKEMYIKSTSVNTISEKSSINFQKSIKSKTLDAVVNQLQIKPNILKIDVHGSEGPLIKGAKKTLINFVNFVLLEVHPPSYIDKYSQGFTREMIVNDVIESGFDCYAIGPFRTLNTDEGRNFVKHKKISSIKISKDSLEKIFFDLSFGSLILAVKKGFDINKLDCFINSKK